MNREELQKVHDALSLLNSMVNCGDQHSPYSVNMTQAAFAILRKPLPPAEGAKKVQWSGYGELGNISQKPLQPTAEGAEEILQKYMDMSMIICPLHVVPRTVALDAMHEFAALHAQKLADKMVSERMEQYKAQFKDRSNPLEVNPYDSKGIKRIRNRKIH